MSKRSSVARLNDMLDHSREAVAFVAGKSRADLDADRLLSLGLVRLLEIIGEAAIGYPSRSNFAILRYRGLRLSACEIA